MQMKNISNLKGGALYTVKKEFCYLIEFSYFPLEAE